MEDWKIDFDWLQIRHEIKARMGQDKLPDLNTILFLIGIQELGYVKDPFSKEEKQDLMHIAVCRLLEEDGYYEFVGMDDEGWPHYKSLKPFRLKGVKAQSELLKEKVIHYFREQEISS